MGVTLPNESPEYRAARERLLEAEVALREQIEEVARLRRALPQGGAIPEDYVFEEWADGKLREVRLSELFKPGDRTLFVYSFMYSPDMDGPCPMCTAFLDGIEGQVRHLERRISTAVVARHDPRELARYAGERGWRNLRLLSSAKNSYNTDYIGEVDGRQMTAANIFERDGDGGEIRHFWNSEMALAPMIEGGELRHVDLAWPLWNILDMSREGRGNWHPSVSYD